jgi:hypothetical protein
LPALFVPVRRQMLKRRNRATVNAVLSPQVQAPIELKYEETHCFLPE